jgi:hypothetical protein
MFMGVAHTLYCMGCATWGKPWHLPNEGLGHPGNCAQIPRGRQRSNGKPTAFNRNATDFRLVLPRLVTLVAVNTKDARCVVLQKALGQAPGEAWQRRARPYEEQPFRNVAIGAQRG